MQTDSSLTASFQMNGRGLLEKGACHGPHQVELEGILHVDCCCRHIALENLGDQIEAVALTKSTIS